MGENSKIAWTDHTFNPWIGCTKVSEGCENCYAVNQAARRGWDHFGKGKPRRRTKPANWNKVRQWNEDSINQNTPLRVFCASLADFCDPEVPVEWVNDLWSLIAETSHLDWLLLTKRPHRLDSVLPISRHLWNLVWMGTTVENQASVSRIDEITRIKFNRRFLSCEPLLGPINFGNKLRQIDWVIVGGESGPNARHMNEDWVRDIRDQCIASNTKFFYKQFGGIGKNSHDLPTLDGRTWTELPSF